MTSDVHTKLKNYVDEKQFLSKSEAKCKRGQAGKKASCPVTGENQVLHSCSDQPARKIL